MDLLLRNIRTISTCVWQVIKTTWVKQIHIRIHKIQADAKTCIWLQLMLAMMFTREVMSNTQIGIKLEGIFVCNVFTHFTTRYRLSLCQSSLKILCTKVGLRSCSPYCTCTPHLLVHMFKDCWCLCQSIIMPWGRPYWVREVKARKAVWGLIHLFCSFRNIN